MCELSNELKFCSCDTKSYYELENSWIIFRRKEGWLIIGQTVFNETELDIKDLEIKNLEKNLNSKQMFDFEYFPEEDDKLKIKITFNEKCSEYDFKFSNKKWSLYNEQPLGFMENLIQDKAPYIEEFSGKIENPFKN